MDTASSKASVEDIGDRVRPKIDEAKQQFGRMNGRITSSIQDHPAVWLLGALALGYMVARLARRRE